MDKYTKVAVLQMENWVRNIYNRHDSPILNLYGCYVKQHITARLPQNQMTVMY